MVGRGRCVCRVQRAFEADDSTVVSGSDLSDDARVERQCGGRGVVGGTPSPRGTGCGRCSCSPGWAALVARASKWPANLMGPFGRGCPVYRELHQGDVRLREHMHEDGSDAMIDAPVVVDCGRVPECPLRPGARRFRSRDRWARRARGGNHAYRSPGTARRGASAAPPGCASARSATT